MADRRPATQQNIEIKQQISSGGAAERGKEGGGGAGANMGMELRPATSMSPEMREGGGEWASRTKFTVLQVSTVHGRGHDTRLDG